MKKGHKEMKAFGLLIKEIRDLHGLSDDELAEILGMDKSKLLQIENGKIDAGHSLARKIYQELKIRPNKLAERYEQKLEDIRRTGR